jgi:lysyl-tRNA synthetase class 1
MKFILEVEDAEKIQEKVFEVARKHELDPPILFKLIYQMLIGSDRGPRLGRYIVDIGREEVARLLLERL